MDTQLFFGNLLMVLAIDGTTLLTLNMEQYQTILSGELSAMTMMTIPSRGSLSFSESPSKTPDAPPMAQPRKRAPARKTTLPKKLQSLDYSDNDDDERHNDALVFMIANHHNRKYHDGDDGASYDDDDDDAMDMSYGEYD